MKFALLCAKEFNDWMIVIEFQLQCKANAIACKINACAICMTEAHPLEGGIWIPLLDGCFLVGWYVNLLQLLFNATFWRKSPYCSVPVRPIDWTGTFFPALTLRLCFTLYIALIWYQIGTRGKLSVCRIQWAKIYLF